MSCFAEFLWAALRCLPESEKEASGLLDPLCEAWGQLPDENSSTDKIEPLQDALFRRGLGDHAVSALIRKATGQLEWPITMLLNQVDAPESVEFTVRQAAAIPGYWSFTSAWEHWEFHGRRLGAASIESLEKLWKNPKEIVKVREKAFRFWEVGVEGTGLDTLTDLQNVGPSEPFYHEALRHRIRLGDQTVTTELIRMTETDKVPHFWWQYAHRIWNESLREALDSFLGRLPEDGRAGGWEWKGHHFCAAELLVEIPAADAEALLVRHWEHLRYRVGFVQAALAIATPRCCELVAATVRNCPDTRRLLKHFEYRCGLRTVGRGQQFGFRQLEAILPYLEFFSDHTLTSLWEHCNRQLWFDFRRRYLDPKLTVEQRMLCRLGREALFQQLDRYLGERTIPWSINREIELAQNRGESWNEFLDALLDWLRERRTFRALEVVAHAFISAGRRTDLARLCEIEIDADPAEVRGILDRTSFQIFRRQLR
jgi:hypothetical protein